MKDLSNDVNSATYALIPIVPRIEDIDNMDMSEYDKVELAIKEVVSGLKQHQLNYPHSMKDGYIARLKSRLDDCLTVRDVITRVNNAINNGRHYEG